MNYDEMRGKQGANMLNHVATLVGQDQFYFFPLLFNNCIVFLALAVLLNYHFLAIAGG